MTLPRTVADVLSDHVRFEVECIDRMYLNVYIPQLQFAQGIVGYLNRQLGMRVASTAPLGAITDRFVTAIRRFAADREIPIVDFARGQRKDDVMHEHLARLTGDERVLFIGRAQEKVPLFRTEKRRDREGKTYPWIVKTTGLVNQFYVYCVDADFGPFFLTHTLDRPLSGRVFFEQVIRDNLDLGRPDQVSLIFDRELRRGGKRPTPGRFRTRVITANVVPSLHVDYKHATIKQCHKENQALRTETTINDTRDFGIGKRLINLPALRQVGFKANRRLLDVQTISHDPINGHTALTAITDPVITTTGRRVAGMRFTDPRVDALLTAILVFRLLPDGFTNRDLHEHLALLLGRHPSTITSGQMSYDLRRLRLHGIIERIPGSHRYQVTLHGRRHAMFLTRLHHRVITTGLDDLARTDDPPALRQAADTYDSALDRLLRQAGLAA
ncbi:hypothetical protein I6A60_00695 [Frankia sp. AgB1.9]|uniref:hypothetical protein n=1 Tax=unclassified Frankia TaxID=2632575 RepID=UPI001934A42A|nr:MULTISPECIES: hypothetical protein [unclassified Frankia]MBL7494207.1 hypothetical protein [Frankia sp. AgW1.1]MBL7546406.1 hypothetical protein [Frankia sp. AgB1.9]MBL7623434.1 hypothetical protein [Frankia sp. AgB1.8]